MAHFRRVPLAARSSFYRTPETIMHCKACHLNMCKVCVMKYSFHLLKYHKVVSLKQDLTGLIVRNTQ